MSHSTAPSIATLVWRIERDQGRRMNWDQAPWAFFFPSPLLVTTYHVPSPRSDLSRPPGRRHNFDPISIRSASLSSEAGPPALCDLNIPIAIRSGLHQSLSLPSRPSLSSSPTKQNGRGEGGKSGTRETYSLVERTSLLLSVFFFPFFLLRNHVSIAIAKSFHRLVPHISL